ncbi:hypothetical protein BH24DEI2_BH24DEI2_11150 [soil metagenome]
MFLAGKPTELWRQLPDEPNLWEGEHGVLINTAALRERETFLDVTRVAATSFDTDFSSSETSEALRVCPA